MYRNLIIAISIALIPIAILIWLKLWLIIASIAIAIAYFNHKKKYKKLQRVFSSQPNIKQDIITWSGIIVSASIVVFFFKTSVFDIVRLPSNSMANTITNGELVFINKLIPGPRLHPNSVSYYSRAMGLSELKRDDILAFNFPEGDTLLMNEKQESYYALKRRFQQTGDDENAVLWSQKKYKKVTQRPQYIKRLIGLPGDTILISEGQVFLNKKPLKSPEKSIGQYLSLGSNPDSVLLAIGVQPINHFYYKEKRIYELETSMIPNTSSFSDCFSRFVIDKGTPDLTIFPFKNFWNCDHLGPIIIPQKGLTIKLNINNIELYYRLIEVYEENDIEVSQSKIKINGITTQQYTFKMNYYWVMGDNLPHSYDSRYWGFLPENHIIGTVIGHL